MLEGYIGIGCTMISYNYLTLAGYKFSISGVKEKVISACPTLLYVNLHIQ